MLTEALINILACPSCHHELSYDANLDQYCECKTCHTLYSIKNSIPILLKNESKPMTSNNTLEQIT
ncbi:MAG: Trm112 family protein [Endozoicomonadaceae bacterium]|nr:Trm112 family protein [Endozoicomonadaceae bacterium]